MPLIRTTMTPTVEQWVSDATADDLRAQGALLEGTRATTDEGLMEAAVRQVREHNYSEETRAGIAESEAQAKAAATRKPRSRPRRAADPAEGAAEQPARRRRGSRARQAEVEVTHADGRTETVTGVLPASAALEPGGSPAADGDSVPTDTSGDVPADSDTQES